MSMICWRRFTAETVFSSMPGCGSVNQHYISFCVHAYILQLCQRWLPHTAGPPWLINNGWATMAMTHCWRLAHHSYHDRWHYWLILATKHRQHHPYWLPEYSITYWSKTLFVPITFTNLKWCPHLSTVTSLLMLASLCLLSLAEFPYEPPEREHRTANLSHKQ